MDWGLHCKGTQAGRPPLPLLDAGAATRLEPATARAAQGADRARAVVARAHRAGRARAGAPGWARAAEHATAGAAPGLRGDEHLPPLSEQGASARRDGRPCDRVGGAAAGRRRPHRALAPPVPRVPGDGASPAGAVSAGGRASAQHAHRRALHRRGDRDDPGHRARSRGRGTPVSRCRLLPGRRLPRRDRGLREGPVGGRAGERRATSPHTARH